MFPSICLLKKAQYKYCWEKQEAVILIFFCHQCIPQNKLRITLKNTLEKTKMVYSPLSIMFRPIQAS